MTVYWADDTVTLHHGDMRDILPALVNAGLRADCALVDPPYNETKLTWDRWPDGWPAFVAAATSSMWCFGSMRMFLTRHAEFAGWQMSQDIVWEKHNGSGFHADRFRRVHEHALHWYRGPWAGIHHQAPTTADATARTVRRKTRPPHMGETKDSAYTSVDGGPRLMRSVINVRSMHGRAINGTEKPVGVLTPLIEYACPSGGLVLDPMAGSGSTAEAARATGRRTVLIEGDEEACEAIARRLSQGVLTAGWPA
ncbi:site-specific DNA-methyltransferase [Polymorphospora rubra]|uniref:DNA-methyltransferase n=1 Tax=Polymorphospora rubra TaxID=338584 RepID=UPI0034030263